MVDLVEARRDVTFQHPLIGAGAEVVDLGDRVLGAASGTEPIRAGLEVRLQDRLKHQLQGGLHHPVPNRRDAKSALAAAWLGDHPLPHRQGHKPPGLQVGPKLGEEGVLAPFALDVVGRLAIHPAERAPLLPRTRRHPTSRNAGSATRLNRSSNRRPCSLVAQWCSLVWIPSTAPPPPPPKASATTRRYSPASSWPASPLAADLLPPLALWPAFPTSDYSSGSAPSPDPQPTTGLPTADLAGRRAGRSGKGSPVHPR